MLLPMEGRDPEIEVEGDPCSVTCIRCRGGLSSLVHIMKCLGVSGFPADIIHEGKVIVSAAWVTTLVDDERVALQNPESMQIEIWPVGMIHPVV